MPLAWVAFFGCRKFSSDVIKETNDEREFLNNHAH